MENRDSQNFIFLNGHMCFVSATEEMSHLLLRERRSAVNETDSAFDRIVKLSRKWVLHFGAFTCFFRPNTSVRNTHHRQQWPNEKRINWLEGNCLAFRTQTAKHHWAQRGLEVILKWERLKVQQLNRLKSYCVHTTAGLLSLTIEKPIQMMPRTSDAFCVGERKPRRKQTENPTQKPCETINLHFAFVWVLVILKFECHGK